MAKRGSYGIRSVPGEEASEKYPGFLKRPNGTYRKSRPWTNTKTGLVRHTSVGYTEKKCGACGSDHLVLLENAKRQLKFSCSKECRSALARAPDGVVCKKKQKHGEGFYVHVRMRNHPQALSDGRVAQHRVVAEASIGRYLRKGEMVHHINMKKDDNRPENLVVCSDNKEHFLAHGSLNSCVQELIDAGLLCFDREEKRYFVGSL
jgi:hypothetical protein